jgi:ribosome-associated heat shock protein Hsp15
VRIQDVEFVARIDKWLWAARFFKTRALAARACELGRIESNGHQAKPAREVRVGDMLQVKNDSGDFQVEVLGISEMRGPAVVAQALYRETEASREARMKLAEERKAMPHFEAWRDGKPSKRDRRVIDRFRGKV